MNKIDLEVENALCYLKKSKIILYPTDTIWGIGCDAAKQDAIERIYQIKYRDKKNPFILLVCDYQMLVKITGELDKIIIEEINSNKYPLTVIYQNIRHPLPDSLFFENSLAIRIVKDEFCKKLIHKLNNPIVSTSANISGYGNSSKFCNIDKEILHKVDYVVDLKKKQISTKPSKIIKFVDGKIRIIRN